jgi:hypothetical protein
MLLENGFGWPILPARVPAGKVGGNSLWTIDLPPMM